MQDSLCDGRVPPACEAYQKGKPTGNRRALATGEYEIDLARVMADGDAMQVSTAAGKAAALAIYNGVIARDATAFVIVTFTAVTTEAQVLNLPPPPHPYMNPSLTHRTTPPHPYPQSPPQLYP